MKTASISNRSFIKAFTCLVLGVVFSICAYAQEDISIPSNYTLESPADFRQYETTVVKCIKWFSETPRNINPAKRRKAEDFLVKWIYGSPYVNVIIEPYIMKLSAKNPDLLLSFMFGYALYQLEHLGDKNLVPANLAGLNLLLKDYQDNTSSFKRDAAIDKILTLQTAGTLTEWLQPQLKEKSLK